MRPLANIGLCLSWGLGIGTNIGLCLSWSLSIKWAMSESNKNADLCFLREFLLLKLNQIVMRTTLIKLQTDCQMCRRKTRRQCQYASEQSQTDGRGYSKRYS